MGLQRRRLARDRRRRRHPGDRPGGLANVQDIIKPERPARACRIAGAVLGRALYNCAIVPTEALKAPPDAEGPRHPCLDVKDGRVVKGVQFVTCATPAIRWSRPAPMTRPAPTS
jgi:hypothetical protein